jgi:hypothetical protein
MNTILSSNRKDWFYIIGSSISGFFLIGFYLFLKSIVQLDEEWAFLATFLCFTLLFDVRHLFSTYSRTILDQDYTSTHKGWLWKSWLTIVIIPILGLYFISKGEYFAYNTSIVLIFATRMTIVLGFYHLVKQNWGFMAIYKKKMNEIEDGSDRWEKLLLLSGSFLPLAYIAKTQIIWFPGEEIAFQPNINQLPYILDLWQKISLFCLILGAVFLLVGFVFKSAVVYKFVSRNLAYYFLGIFLFIRCIQFQGFDWTMNLLLIILALLFFTSLIFTIVKANKRNSSNPRKWAVLISSLILYTGVLLFPIEHKYVLVMAVTLPHNIQYLSFVKFFNEKVYLNSTKKHGLAKAMTQKMGLFIIISFVYALLFEAGRTGIKFLPLHEWGDGGFIIRNVILLFFISMVLHHYYLDAVIWRVRKDENLKDVV